MDAPYAFSIYSIKYAGRAFISCTALTKYISGIRRSTFVRLVLFFRSSLEHDRLAAVRNKKTKPRGTETAERTTIKEIDGVRGTNGSEPIRSLRVRV